VILMGSPTDISARPLVICGSIALCSCCLGPSLMNHDTPRLKRGVFFVQPSQSPQWERRMARSAPLIWRSPFKSAGL